MFISLVLTPFRKQALNDSKTYSVVNSEIWWVGINIFAKTPALCWRWYNIGKSPITEVNFSGRSRNWISLVKLITLLIKEKSIIEQLLGYKNENGIIVSHRFILTWGRKSRYTYIICTTSMSSVIYYTHIYSVGFHFGINSSNW